MLREIFAASRGCGRSGEDKKNVGETAYAVSPTGLMGCGMSLVLTAAGHGRGAGLSGWGHRAAGSRAGLTRRATRPGTTKALGTPTARAARAARARLRPGRRAAGSSRGRRRRDTSRAPAYGGGAGPATTQAALRPMSMSMSMAAVAAWAHEPRAAGRRWSARGRSGRGDGPRRPRGGRGPRRAGCGGASTLCVGGGAGGERGPR